MGTEHPRIRIRHRVRHLCFFFLLVLTALITAAETRAWPRLFSVCRQIRYIAQYGVPAQRNDKSLEAGADEIPGHRRSATSSIDGSASP
jgi:hypothetical protein